MKNKPLYDRKRIFGIETEYGTQECNVDREWLPNGGLVYDDGDHVEYATPETRNPRDAVLHDKAGELIALKKGKGIFRNNVALQTGVNVDSLTCIDYNNFEFFSTYGTHENYFTCVSKNNLHKLIPFLVTRQLYAGSGDINLKGQFEISQRSRFILTTKGGYTTDGRSIINTKDETHSNVGGWSRLHLILGDANMCEMADYLKIGITSLVLDLLEDEKNIGIKYSPDGNAIVAIHNVSEHANSASLEGIVRKSLTPVDVQRSYLKAATKAYSGRDRITDDLLKKWSYVLDKLESNPSKLFGWVDWITKKTLIDSYALKHDIYLSKIKSYGEVPDSILNINLLYHSCDKNKSLFYALQGAGKIKRLLTDAQIERATLVPPKDTRANARGKIVVKSEKYGFDFDSDDGYEWDSVSFGGGDVVFDIDDPFNTYPDIVKKVRKNMFDDDD